MPHKDPAKKLDYARKRRQRLQANYLLRKSRISPEALAAAEQRIGKIRTVAIWKKKRKQVLTDREEWRIL